MNKHWRDLVEYIASQTCEGIYIEKGPWWWDKGEVMRSQDRSLQHLGEKYVAEESFLRIKELEREVEEYDF